MSKEEKNKMVPDLRFPEFKDSEEWNVKEFSKYIVLYRGSSPRPIQDYLTKSNIGVNWIKIGDTKSADNFIINQVEEKITPKGAEKSRKVNSGELILANSMSFGKTYELAINGFIYDGWFVLREYETYFHKQFLIQLLNSDFMQNQYLKFSAGGIVQNISSDIVYKTILPHTSILEQQKIADCLSSLDEFITAQNQKLEALKAHKKGLMQQLFPAEGETLPQLRFAEFRDSGEWVPFYLIELSEEKLSNGVFNDPNKTGKGYRLINVLDMYIERYIDETLLSFLDINELEFNKNKVENGDIFFTRSSLVKSGIAHSNIYLGFAEDITFDGHLIRLRPNKKIIHPLFLYFDLKTSSVRTQLIAKGKTATMTTIGQSDIAETKTFIPKIDEQQKIAECLSSLDELITAQADKIEAIKAHKKGLMQGLFPQVSEL